MSRSIAIAAVLATPRFGRGYASIDYSSLHRMVQTMPGSDLSRFGWRIVIDTDQISYVGDMLYERGSNYFEATIGGQNRSFSAKKKNAFLKPTTDPDLIKLREFLIACMKAR